MLNQNKINLGGWSTRQTNALSLLGTKNLHFAQAPFPRFSALEDGAKDISIDPANPWTIGFTSDSIGDSQGTEGVFRGSRLFLARKRFGSIIKTGKSKYSLAQAYARHACCLT